jgi:hypothetical protein
VNRNPTISRSFFNKFIQKSWFINNDKFWWKHFHLNRLFFKLFIKVDLSNWSKYLRFSGSLLKLFHKFSLFSWILEGNHRNWSTEKSFQIWIPNNFHFFFSLYCETLSWRSTSSTWMAGHRNRIDFGWQSEPFHFI